MDIEPLRLALEITIGLAVGIISGILGIGGGVLLVPAMVFLLQVNQHTAQGVSLAVIVPTAIVGSLSHYRQGNVLVSTAVLLGAVAVIGAVIGAVAAGWIEEVTLRRLFGLFTIAIAMRMFLSNRR